MSDLLDQICASLAAIGAGIPFSKPIHAFDPPPADIQSAHLPALFIWTGAGTHNEEILGADLVRTTRRFYLQVAVIPISQGDPNTREKLVRPLLSQTLNHFRKYPQLDGLAHVQEARIGSDSGIIVLPEYGGKFIGFEIPMDVTTITDRDYAPGE